MTLPPTVGLPGSPPTPPSGDEQRLLAELSSTLAPRIQVVSLLGRGGMGFVYLGRDPLLKRSIAIKVLSPEFSGAEIARARFTREAQAAATMTHPNVAAVHDVGDLPSGAPYFLMQFVEGTSLDEVVKTTGMFTEPRARRLIGEVASALAAAHARGLVHRDVKPANVIVENESKRAIVVDFGISAALDKERFDGSGTLTQVGMYVGTPRYTSPEQASGSQVDGKADVYSLGILAYEILTGRVPFEETNQMALLAAHMMGVPAPVRTLRPDLDTTFAALVDRCLLKDPAARPEAAEIASFLVPEPQPAVEWPPPGLDDVGGLAVRAARAVNWFGAFATLFIAVLAVQPTRGTAAWDRLETSLAWSLVSNVIGSREDTTPMWIFLLALLMVGAIAAMVFVVMRTVGLWTAVKRGRQLGYPTNILMAVAIDDHDDTADLLHRSGPFAMLTPEQQKKLIRARRARVLALPAGLLLTVALAVFWFLAPPTRAYSVALLPAGDALLLLLPAIAGVLAYLQLHSVEQRLRDRTLLTRTASFQTRAEFVRDWLQRVAGATHVRVTPAALVVPAIGLALGALMVIMMLVVGSSILTSTTIVSQGRTADQGATVVRDELLLDAALADLTRGLRTAPGDSGAMSALAVGMYSAVVERASPAVPDDYERAPHIRAARRALAALGADSAKPADMSSERQGTAYRFIHGQGPLELTDAQMTALMQSPWPGALRRFGRSDSGAGPYFYPTAELLRDRGLGHLNANAWIMQIPGASSAIAQFTAHQRGGRTGEARAIAFDVLRAGIRLRRSPERLEYLRGMYLVRAALQMLQELPRSARDTLATQVTTARNALNTVEREQGSGSWYDEYVWMVSGNLDEQSAALPMIADRNQPPHKRWRIMEGLVFAYCTNAREILFGVSPRRRLFVDSAAVLASDIPRTNEWRDILRARLDRWDSDPAAELLRVDPMDTENSAKVTVLRSMGWRGLAARIEYCERF